MSLSNIPDSNVYGSRQDNGKGASRQAERVETAADEASRSAEDSEPSLGGLVVLGVGYLIYRLLRGL